MTQYEMVEKLREKANVSYEEAKAALEQSNWDLLDAMVLLEKQGRVGAEHVEYSTQPEHVEPEREERRSNRRAFAEGMGRFGRFVAGLVRRGNANVFEVSRNGQVLFTLPVTALVLLALLLRIWTCLIALVVGLFFGCRYAFRGPDLGAGAVNDAMARASEVVDEMKRGHDEHKD
ncbi:MAG: DUF4342 domain-containing protein [Clostridiales bacterium]|nr:DUF4342 domain-containing protein [Clostridiales bacterium]